MKMSSLQKLTHFSTRAMLNLRYLQKSMSSSPLTTLHSVTHVQRCQQQTQNDAIRQRGNNGQIMQLWDRNMSTSARRIYDYSLLDSGDQKIIEARNLLRMKNTIPTYILRKSSVFLYESCTDKINFDAFLDKLNLEDTFSTWFIVTALHAWMLGARCMAEGPAVGTIARNELFTRMWEDVSERVRKLARMKLKMRAAGIKSLYHQFNAMLLSLDEGLLSDDMTMAGALWRTVFGITDNPDPEKIELLLQYVRCQLEHLHLEVRSEHVLFKGDIDWHPFQELIPNSPHEKSVKNLA